MGDKAPKIEVGQEIKTSCEGKQSKWTAVKKFVVAYDIPKGTTAVILSNKEGDFTVWTEEKCGKKLKKQPQK